MAETITVKSVEQKVGQNGPYVRVVDTNDVWYFVHDSKLFEQALTAKVLVAEVASRSKDGNTFRTIKSIQSATADPAGLPSKPGPSTQTFHQAVEQVVDKEHRIAAAVALKAAVDVWCRTGTSLELQDSTVVFNWTVTLANLYLEWLDPSF